MDTSKYKVSQNSKVNLKDWKTSPSVEIDFKKKSKKKIKEEP